jgi:agmatine deiminase
MDNKAFEIYVKAFPGREIIQVPAREIAFGGAGLRAIALGQPAGLSPA